MKITSQTKIFIICPAGKSTGGPEALHQLCHKLRHVLGYDARMVYIKKKFLRNSKPDVYSVYKTEKAKKIIDNKENILIIPESLTHYIYEYRNIQKVVWWLSVDFYAICMKNRQEKRFKFYFSKYIQGKKEVKEYLLEDLPDVYHWAQSYRSFLYLLDHGIAKEKIKRVCDYMNPLFLERTQRDASMEKKQNIILYNPKKGREEIESIKEKCIDYQWIPIRGMTPEQVSDTMRKAKLYIDFGYNPGRDRMLRESTLMKCIIISGKNGSSKYQEDLNIPEAYKFEYSRDIIPKIVTKIHEVITNYERCISDFIQYSQETLEEEKNFEKQLETIFNYNN
ncbi:MAG: hypothetical protein LBP34_01820 [Flavobacteriaceae bacterium]|jgi:hypothetical protein|nr:hypothetical protein [Flavobacteriaceae bacterium]